MTSVPSLLGAVGIGLLGSVHCVAMCGGIAGALAMTLPPDAPAGARARLQASLSSGRLLGYATAGALAGGFGLGVVQLLGPTGTALLRVAAGVVLLGVACVVAGLWGAPLLLERLGARLWRHLTPMVGALRGRPGGGRAILLGMLWGWVPCGLVYSALGWSATTGDPLAGAAVMVAFGAGTLPAMLLTGTAAARLRGIVRDARPRRLAAVMLAGFALWTLVGGGRMVAAARTSHAPSCHATAD